MRKTGAAQNTTTPILQLHSLLLELPVGWKKLQVTYTDAQGKTQSPKFAPRS